MGAIKKIKSKQIFIHQKYGELLFPSKIIITNEAKMPLEVYVKENRVALKVVYRSDRQKITMSAPPRFEVITENVDLGLVFENGIEIKNVNGKLWNTIPKPERTDYLIVKIRKVSKPYFVKG